MARFLLTSLIALGLLCSGPARAATALSDGELADVSGGGVALHLEGQSLPQEQQQPGSNNAGYTPPQQQQINDGMDPAPELFAILQSTIDVTRERKLLLNGTTQQDARVLNLENVLSSDTVSVTNIFEGSSVSIMDVTSEVEINQLNSLIQRHRAQGSLDSSIAGYRYEETVESRSGAESYEYSTYSLVDRNRLSVFLRTDSDDRFAQVGSRFTSFSKDALRLDIIEPKEFDRALGFSEGGFLHPLGVKTGLEAAYTGIQLTGPGLSIESISTRGNELVLGTRLTPPKLDFGHLDVEVCPVPACGSPSLLNLGKQSFNLGPLGLDTIHPKFVFPGIGPKVDELNLGTGFTVDGSGQLTMDPGSFTINGELVVKVTPFASATLDLSKVEVLGTNLGLGKFGFTEEFSFDLVDKTIPFELLDEKLEIAPIDIALVDQKPLPTETLLYQDNGSIIQEYNPVDVAESSFSEAYEHSVFTGGQMTGAEAELLAMSEGTLSVDNSNVVSLTGGVQQNMRVVNGVNAVSTIAANGLNISRSPSFTVSPSGAPRLLLIQQNRFNQQR